MLPMTKIHCTYKNYFHRTKKKQLTVSGPTTFDGGGIDRRGFLSSGPGLFLDNRFLVDKSILPDRGFIIPLPPDANGLAAKSSPFD